VNKGQKEKLLHRGRGRGHRKNEESILSKSAEHSTQKLRVYVMAKEGGRINLYYMMG